MTHKGINIINEFNHKIYPSQLKWLDKMIEQYGGVYNKGIISVHMTRGGYISVDYVLKHSTLFRYAREIRGIRGGWIESLSGKGYDFVNGWILDGIKHSELNGVEKFNMQ